MSKRYYVVADVHGYADLLKKGLKEAGFDSANPDHIFVSLGDLTDRGHQAAECIEYVMSLPNRVLIRGNHEDLVNYLMFYARSYDGADVQNGTCDTVRQFAEKTRGFAISNTLMEMTWQEVVRDAMQFNLWKQYYNELRNYYEVDGFVFVHGWIPVEVKDWRNEAASDMWNSAVWAKTPRMVKYECWDNGGKTIVCGHWHSWEFWKNLGGETSYKFDPYIDPHFIAMDACTAFSRQINVLVIEDGKVVDQVCVRD